VTIQWARTANGKDLLLPTLGSGQSALERDPLACAQIKLSSVLAFVKGEWALDESIGFPWRDIWGHKNPNLVAIRHTFRKYILATPPVVALVDFALAYNAAVRNIAYAFEARIATGETVTGGGP